MDFYILNQNEVVTATLSTDSTGKHTPIYSASVDEKLKSYDILELSVPADIENKQDIKEEYSVVFKDIKGWREYIINEVEDEDDGTIERTITAELSSIELLDEVLESNVRGSNPAEILGNMLKNTRWSVGSVDASIYNQAFGKDTTMISVLEGIDILADHFNAEVSFSYAVAGNKVTKRFVNLTKQIGADNGKRFEVDKDVTSIKRTIDTTALKTAVIPIGKEPEEGKKRLDITNVVWSKAKGDPVDKPKGQNWLGDPEALKAWGKNNADGSRRHRIFVQEIDVETDSELISMGWVHLGRYTKPKNTYEVKALDLYTLTGDEDLKHEYANLGDTVVVTDYYFAEPLVVQTRVVELKRDLIDPLNNDLVFGDSKQSFSVNSVVDRVDEIDKNLSNKIEVVKASADGKTNTYMGSQNPAKPKEGDMWYRPHPNIPNEEQYLVFNGLTWDVVLDTSNLTEVGKEVNKVIEQVEKDREKAEQDFEKAKEEAKKYTDTKVLAFNTELGTVKTDLATTKTNANNAVTKADQAIKDAGFAKVDAGKAKEDATKAITDAAKAKTDANKAITDAGTALSTANTAKTNAGTALTTAQTSLTNSGTALEKAGQALSKATTAETETGKLSTSYNNLTQTVGLKADKTEVSTIKGTVTQHGLDITANATAIGLKADKTVTDIINQTVAKHTTDIKATADGLAMKAEKALVDSLNGTVATHTSQIKATSDGLALKADKSLVDTVKGTVDTHTTQIKATAEGLKLKADSSLVNTVKGTVDKHTLDISANASAITAKADKSVVDTINKTVESHTLSIKATAEGLATKAEKTLVDSINKTVKETKATVDLLPEKIELGVSDAKTYVDQVTDGSSVVDKTSILSGNPIYTDKADDAVVHVGVDGKSVGGGVKNLFNLSWYVSLEKDRFSKGTYSLTPSGELSVNNVDSRGTDKSEYSYYQPVKPNTTYTFSADIEMNWRIQEYSASGALMASHHQGSGKTKTFTTSASAKIITFKFFPVSVAYPVIVGKLQLEEGAVVTSYDPKPAPTPDYPIAINSLGKSFDIVSSVGKENLLQEYPPITGEGKDTYVVKTPVLDKLEYTVSFDAVSNSGKTIYISNFFYSPNTTISSSTSLGGEKSWPNGSDGHTPFNITTEKKRYWITWKQLKSGDAKTILLGRVPTGANVTISNVKLQEGALELGSEVPLYTKRPSDIPYDTQTPTLYKTNILLSEPLRSVGDVKDRLFLDTDGLWKVERSVGEKVLSSGFAKYGGPNYKVGNNFTTFSISIPDRKLGYNTSLMSHLPNLGTNTQWDTPSQVGYNDHGSYTNIYMYMPNDVLGLNWNADDTTSKNAMNNWASRNPMTIQYQLATPTIETLPAEQQVKLNNIQSFKGSNYVYTVGGSGVVPELNGVFKSAGWTNNFKTAQKIAMNETKLTVQAGEIATKVSNIEFDNLAGKQSATDSRLTQTASTLNSKVTAVETDLSKRATKTEFTELTQTVSGITTRVGNSEGKITAVEQNVKGIQSTVADKADKSQITQLSNQISTKVESATYTSKMTQLDSAINLRVTKGDVIAQINVEAGKTLIQNKQIVLDGNTYIMGNTFVNDIKAKSLDAVYADIATLKTKVLTTDVITSTMLKSDVALINKIFVNDANINVLTSKTAFINSVKAVDISADRIKAGTLNASNVSIINLNASNITAGILKGTNLSINLGTGDVLFQKGVIKSSDSLLAMDITNKRFESYDSRGGFTLENGAINLYKKPIILDNSATNRSEMYGKIDYGNNLWNGLGMTVEGTDGLFLQLKGFSQNLIGSGVKGAGIAMNKGNVSIEAMNNVILTGGNSYNSGIVPALPTVAVGVNYRDTTVAKSADVRISGNAVRIESPNYQVDWLPSKIVVGTKGRDMFEMSGDYYKPTFDLGGGAIQHYHDSAGAYLLSKTIYNRTTSTAANAYVSSNGTLARSTSASKYKLNISEIPNIEDYSAKILEIKPKQWFDKSAVENYVEEVEHKSKGRVDDAPITPFYGLIAEDLVEAGLEKYVHYGSDGKEVEGIMYDRLWTLLIPIVKQQKEDITDLKTKLAELENVK